MSTLKNALKKFRRFYYMYREFVKLKDDRNRLLKVAEKSFADELPKQGSLADYKRALFRHGVSYKEYMYCYKFWKLGEKQRAEFISERAMRCIYRKTVQPSVAMMFRNKVSALEFFKLFVHRKWMYPKTESFESFVTFVNSMDCLAKPIKGSLGMGIVLINKDDNNDLEELYKRFCENDYVIEERLNGCKEMQEFHPQSLNTLRVFTVTNNGRSGLVSAMMRVGVGDSIIDNASAGGIVACVDIETGVVCGDGADKLGNTYVVHPESGKAFKGFVIPHWTDVVDTCKKMSSVVHELVFAGWDICVLQNGTVELVEVNSTSNMSGLQTASGKGIKPRLRDVGKEVLGYDPVKLASVWSKSYVKYNDKYGQYDLIRLK